VNFSAPRTCEEAKRRWRIPPRALKELAPRRAEGCGDADGGVDKQLHLLRRAWPSLSRGIVEEASGQYAACRRCSECT